MYKEALNQRQWALLPLLSAFKKEYYLVGGTAIALYIGHRRSTDFDLFKYAAVDHRRNLETIGRFDFPVSVLRRGREQMELMINDVKWSFCEYPFDIQGETVFENRISLPSLLDLAAMKAYALARRSKWKDYVDLYFLLKYHFTMEEVVMRAEKIYEDLFSDKFFRAQLTYYKDVDYSERVDYLIVHPPEPEEIRSVLIEKAISIL
jgi:predicted nucleotidyltransferase component of viral defense system